jgi:hypothetical protein
MKHYIQFKALSTGYIKGTIPPQFSDSCIEPIDRLGSDGIYYLDNRLSLSSMVSKGIALCKQRNNTIGFSVVSYYDSIINSYEVRTVLFNLFAGGL